ncbi:aldo/keto reductase [Bifidobacterium bombi]|uniref:Oxidoreductase, aldo/keto reductase family n=1 Tax=Bifidobacterium bombi DSM 19703 TaxID=1341695 RepID=A0A080N204_9BIFI|nr:aldo/keto reductase [Bifidobacterium bombi]KFF30937.1 oxidoreductase, aldo/keto reductase family [Bifidobacterium bombi DSM 19703]
MSGNILNETYTMANGMDIPKLGLGTWFIDDDKAAQAVRDAVSIGYRLIDTAEAYDNECGVGEGVRTCGIERKNIFVTTKLAAEAKSYESARKAIQESLDKLDIGYIDMMIIHAPQPWDDFRGGDYSQGNREAWRALEEFYTSGRIRAIGVSNFKKSDIENILSSCTVKPVVNQLLVHVSNTPSDLMDYCKKQGILVEGYSPVAHGVLLKSPQMAQMAEKYGVSVPQLCIRYDLQLGTVALPKTGNPEHMRSNADVDFEISEEDMESLKAVQPIKDYGEFSHFPVYSGK